MTDRLRHSLADGPPPERGEVVAEAPEDFAALLELLGARDVLPRELIERAREAPPLRLGPYEVRAWLGEGGMGTVLRAFDPQLGREVALKLLADRREASVERFRREARALARLNHPSVVEVYGLHLEEQVPLLAMELIEGESLDRVLAARGPLSEEAAWTLLEQASAALEHAEGQGVLHRDLKPSNLMAEGEGPDARYRLCDFGLAHLEDVASSLSDGSRSRLVGSLPYMSPEQLRLQPVDARSDMYSLGVTVFELLTGSLPQRSLEHSDEEPERLDLAAHRPGVAPGLAALVGALTERRRDDRPYSWAAVRDLVRAARAGALEGELALEAGAREPVPAGVYVVGYEGLDATAYERPRVEVRLSAFAIDRAPFSRRELLALLAAHPGRPELARFERPDARGALAADPAAALTGVTFEEASAIARLARARLPSRLEWEAFALLALQRGTAEAWGLFALQEWCDDWLEHGFHARLARAGAPQDDPRGAPAARERRVVVGRGRGAAIPRRPSYCLGYPPGVRRADLGFRLVNRGREGSGPK